MIHRLFVFYLGTTPVVSLIHNTVHLLILQLGVWVPHSVLLVLSCLQAIGWLITSIFWTVCEVSNEPGPAFCPQNFSSSVVIHGQHMIGVTTLKDVLAWSMAAVYIGLALTARKGIYHKRKIQWRAKDEFHELTEYEPRMPFAAWGAKRDGAFDETRKEAATTATAEVGGTAIHVACGYETKI